MSASLRVWLVFGCLFPLLSAACGVESRRHCNERWQQLVTYRAAAIEYAFGDPFALPEQIGIEFFSADDPLYGQLKGRVAYDSKRHVLLVSRSLRMTEFPRPLSAAQAYWPFYADGSYHDTFKVIGAIDNTLWTAHLQEAAEAQGLSWPHAACTSVDVGKRLPCEMVLAGIVEHVTTRRLPIFNENRLDTIWPEDFERFRSSVWLRDAEYEHVKRYGGILLMRPLIAQFGVVRVMAYAAQTPFDVSESSLRVAALRYQQQARETLSRQAQARADCAGGTSACGMRLTSN